MRIAMTGTIFAALSGCTTMEAVPPQPQTDCDAKPAETFIGKDAAAIAEQARAAAKAEAVRVIGPNQAVTMDFRPERLNLETGSDGKVVKMRCG